MAKKYTIYVYDDLCVVDDTDVLSNDNEQANEIAKSMLNQSSEGITSEVWASKKLVAKFKKSRNGNITKVKNPQHPNWGGRRSYQPGRPSKKELALVNRVVLHVNEEMFQFLDKMGTKKPEWIRQAIQEKREREQGSEKG